MGDIIDKPGKEPNPKKLTKLSNIIKELKKHPELTILHITERKNENLNKREVKIGCDEVWSSLHYHLVPTDKPVNKDELDAITEKLFNLYLKSYDSSKPYTFHGSNCYDLRKIIDFREKIGEGKENITQNYSFTSKKVIQEIFGEDCKKFNNKKLKVVNKYSCNYYNHLRLTIYQNIEYAKNAFEENGLTLSEKEQSKLDDLLKQHQQYEPPKRNLLQKIGIAR